MPGKPKHLANMLHLTFAHSVDQVEAEALGLALMDMIMGASVDGEFKGLENVVICNRFGTMGAIKEGDGWKHARHVH